MTEREKVTTKLSLRRTANTTNAQVAELNDWLGNNPLIPALVYNAVRSRIMELEHTHAVAMLKLARLEAGLEIEVE